MSISHGGTGPLRVVSDADFELADAAARRLATRSVAADDPTGWFEQLYAEAATGAHGVPWDRGEPHRLIVEWAQQGEIRGAGGLAIVVGCGLGDDAEFVASLGFDTVAFDVSATAVATARSRHPGSAVDYAIADLLHLPEHWHHSFDLVVESMTVQSMPPDFRATATRAVAGLVGPGGTLLVVASARDEGRPDDGPPWRLTRAEVDAFAADDVQPVLVEDLRDRAAGTRRWRAELRRPR